MKTPGQTINSPFYGAIREMPDDSHFNTEGVPCEGNIYASNVFLGANSWQDKENPGRPYMHIMGECRAIKGIMPYGVTELTFEEGKGIPVDIFYEFTDDELSSMVKKGLFKPGFKCPEEMYTNVLEMPLACNFTAVAPQAGSDVPILFADIANKQYIVTNSGDCGYTFGDYFKEAVVPEIEDEFIDFSDVEVEDDLFEQSVEEKVEEVVETYEPTEAEKEVAKHYCAIYERVVEDHLNKPVELKRPAKHLATAAPEDKPEVKPEKALVVSEAKPEKVLVEDVEKVAETIPEDKGRYVPRHAAPAPKIAEQAVASSIAEQAAAKVLDMEVDEHGEVDAKKATHSMLIADMTDADELLAADAITNLTEDYDYRMGQIDELFTQNPDAVIDRMKQVAAYEPSVDSVIIRAKAEAERMRLIVLQQFAEVDKFDEDVDSMILEAMSGEKIGDDFHSNLVHKQVPQHIQDVAELAEKAKEAEAVLGDFDDALD